MQTVISTAISGGLRFILRIPLISAAAALFASQVAESMPVPPKLVSENGYARLLDLVFPRERVTSVKVAYTMVLRFEPNRSPESQLLFRVWYDGHIDAQKWTVRSGSAWSSANSYIAKTGKEDIDAISRLIAVGTTKVDVSAAVVKGWHASLFECLRLSNSQLEKDAVEYFKNGTTNAVLDGTRYDFWYSQGLLEARWSFLDVDIADALNTSNFPLARWMNTLRLAVERFP